MESVIISDMEEKMKIRRINKWWSALGIMAALVLVLCIINIVHLSGQEEKAAEERRQSTIGEEKNFDPEKYTYAKDTCYTGAPYLSDELFKIPFGRTDAYVCNNDFIKMIGEENAVMLANNSKKVAEALFDLSYQERDGKDPVLLENLVDGLHVLFANGTFTESKEDTIELVSNWFVENQISMEAEFYTDKCMVFYDNSSVIVRGQLVFTAYGDKGLETLQQYFGRESMEPGKEYAVVMEMELISKTNAYDYDTYQLCGIKLIS